MRAIDFFDKGCDLAGDRIALVEGDTRLTFPELRGLSFRLAAGLRRDGAARQSTVALYGPNHWTILAALLGLWRAECKWVPVNARNAVDANAEYLAYTKCERIFYHSAMADDVAELKRRVPSIVSTICLDTGLEAFVEGLSADDFVEEVDCFGNLTDYVGVFATGGTTGPAKGVQVTNLGWGTMLATATAALDTPGIDKVCLVSAPLTHAAGPVSTLMLSLGATNIILPGFDAGRVLEEIGRHKVTHLYLSPTALYMLLDHPDLARHDYSSLKRFLLAGSPVSPDRFAQAVEVFGPCMCQSYGQVETPMIATFLPPAEVAAAAAGDRPERLASCGRASPHVRVGIMDDDGNLLPPGQPGEIVTRGPLVSDHYFELPEATAEAHRDGWHHTGDVAYRDADGYFYIVDRKKDMVVTGGFNVFTAEVESTIMELPGVLEVAVIGVPDPKWGEAVKAVIVPRAGAEVDPAAVIAHAKARLGGVKAPKSIDLVDALPKTPNGKIDKKGLRGRYWGGTQRMVG